MRLPADAVATLLCAWPSLVAAAPHHGAHAASFAVVSDSRPLQLWHSFTDAISTRIWGEKETQVVVAPHTQSKEASDAGLVARYGDEVVVRFTIKTSEEASALAKATETLFLDVWEFNADWADIRISKDVLPSLLGLLPKSLQNAHVPLMQDLDLAQAILDSYPAASSATQFQHEDSRFSAARLSPSPSTQQKNPFFQNYQPMSVITPWMDLMASMFRDHVSKINVGMTYEGRDIPGLRVGVHPTNNEQAAAPRRTILITGGSHAREWISVSTVTYVAWSLINAYGKDQWITKMLESFDFVFIPTLNPDGYVYSWEEDRLWRKNRQPTSLRFCQGVDLDRSYGFKWDGDSMRTNPCSESYAGTGPFNGVEAQRFADWAKNETEYNNVEFLGFFDLHSYSQQILYPYSYTCDQDPPTIEDLEELALGLAKAIRVSHKGHSYSVASACEGNVAMAKDGRQILPRLESTGGSALDWFYHEMRVKYAYQIKLRDTGSYGFLLPREDIIPTGEEVLKAIDYFGKFVLGEVGLSVDQGPTFSKPNLAEEQDIPDLEENSDSNDEFQFELRRKR